MASRTRISRLTETFEPPIEVASNRTLEAIRRRKERCEARRRRSSLGLAAAGRRGSSACATDAGEASVFGFVESQIREQLCRMERKLDELSTGASRPQSRGRMHDPRPAESERRLSSERERIVRVAPAPTTVAVRPLAEADVAKQPKQPSPPCMVDDEVWDPAGAPAVLEVPPAKPATERRLSWEVPSAKPTTDRRLSWEVPPAKPAEARRISREGPCSEYLSEREEEANQPCGHRQNYERTAPGPLGRRNSRVASFRSSCSSSNISELLQAKVNKVRSRRGRVEQWLWQFLEEPDSSAQARWFARLRFTLVALNVIFCVLEAHKTPQGAWRPSAGEVIVLLVFDIIFVLEAALRFIVSPKKAAFFLSLNHVIDMVGALPLLLSAAILLLREESAWTGRLYEALIFVPVVRLFKLVRSFEKLHLLERAFFLAGEALPVLLYMLCVIVLTFSALIFYVEPRENIGSLTEAVWLTVVSIMTVGYGDVVPVSTPGHVVMGSLIVFSGLYMSVPFGIVGGSFSRVWEDRDRLLLMNRTRDRLHQWGYTPKDILELFYVYDKSKSGELNLQEFSHMMCEMQLGIGPERVVNLFRSFDSDGSGSVDDEEFVRTLYPHSFFQIYAQGGLRDEGDSSDASNC